MSRSGIDWYLDYQLKLFSNLRKNSNYDSWEIKVRRNLYLDYEMIYDINISSHIIASILFAPTTPSAIHFTVQDKVSSLLVKFLFGLIFFAYECLQVGVFD